MKWLHISDLHFNYKGYESKKLKDKLIDKLDELSLNVDFILITGDCFYQYTANMEQQNKMIDFIKLIAKKCNCSNKKVYLCQGNHDVNRYDDNRNKIIEEIREGIEDFSQKYGELSELGNEKFQKICKGVTGYDYDSYKVFHPKNSMFRIISINSTLLSKDKNDSGKLKICNEKLIELGEHINNDDKINIAIMHHGIEYLDIKDAKKFEHWLDDTGIDVVFCGHAHQSSLDTLKDTFREIKQITAGGILIDGYSTPSFHVCHYDIDSAKIKLQLYTYASNKEDWILDNHSLRKYKNGLHEYTLPRLSKAKDEKGCLQDITAIDDFNRKYFSRYNSEKIYSNKFEGEEIFNSWKIINSLVNIGMSYNKALMITNDVINEITANSFSTTNELLSCFELRKVVYKAIINYKPQKDESEFEVSCWASRYARKYNRNKEILVLGEEKEPEKLNYTYIKNVLIKQIIDSITKNGSYYKKITGKELCQMSEDILSFLKSMEIFEIQYNVLVDLIKEYMTQKPHPWIVNNNRSELIKYHKKQAEKHIKELNLHPVICSQIEAAYHICSTFCAKYDEYIGCSEISPIISLANAANWLYNDEKFENDELPVLRHKIVQLKKDLEEQYINFDDFKRTLNSLVDKLIRQRNITSDVGKDSILKLWEYLLKIENHTPNIKTSFNTPIERLVGIFSAGDGFIVKSPLRALPNCFWMEPNWDKHECVVVGMGIQILICVINKIEDVEEIYSYFYKDEYGAKFREVVFALDDYRHFSQEERTKVREIFRGKNVRCIFIQEDNYREISASKNWREIFHRVFLKSK